MKQDAKGYTRPDGYIDRAQVSGNIKYSQAYRSWFGILCLLSHLDPMSDSMMLQAGVPRVQEGFGA